MAIRTIKQILIERDGKTEAEADELINQAKDDLHNRFQDEEKYGDPYEICYDWFGLEPDYIMELM
jgi:hypothetical protein